MAKPLYSELTAALKIKYGKIVDEIDKEGSIIRVFQNEDSFILLSFLPDTKKRVSTTIAYKPLSQFEEKAKVENKTNGL
jgi:bisphosphoglycerate-independent phosphoglycerate mutase (AlkP superfamily)